MLKEEYRFHTSFSNKYGFFLFPGMIMILTFILALATPQLVEQLNLDQIFLSLHSSLFLYGISMGSFAFLGREYVERRSGKINFLISSPMLLPIKFRKTFIAFYLHDVIFYFFMVIIPFTCGLAMAIPLMGFNPFSVVFLSITLFISFIIGLSFSFFMSAVYIKNTPVFVGITVVIAVFIGSVFFIGGEIGYILPALNVYTERSIDFALLSIFYISFYSIVASLLIEERFESSKAEYQTYLPEVTKKFGFFKNNSFLYAKEYLDLIRSRALTKIAFSFILPLLFITFISWLVKTQLVMEIEFNSVFYASMVGFFSVMIYYWIANMDSLESNVPLIIKTKLFIFIIISSVISSIYIIIISGINSEFHLIGISLFVMFTTSFYIATATAYLTGLRTQSYLFNFEVLFKFCLLSALPLTCLQIIVLNLNTFWFVAITALGLTSFIMIIATIILYRGIESKWAGAEFT
jgi:hypothetical protein